MRTMPSNNMPSIREIVVPATEEALNAAVTEHQIEPDKIISIILQPRAQLAMGEHEAKYRLIYRM
jgi:hypothetical protein